MSRMNHTWDDEPRYVPILVREDCREQAEREIAFLEAEADQRDATEAFYR